MTDHGIGKILGPPGTGKTSEIMRLVDAAAKKYLPNRVGVVSFTKAAMGEVKSRIAQITGETSKVAKNVRTLHSHCFKLLGITRDHVAESNLSSFNNFAPNFALEMNPQDNTDECYNPYSADKRNQRLLQKSQILRNQMVPEEDWLPDVRAFGKAWKKWLYMEDYIDFTGMLEQVYERELIPEIDILFVDEAQDLTPLQYAITQRWSQNVNFTIYAGDSDQSIFRFQGAIPEVFRDMHKDWTKNLSQSYRISPEIWKYSLRVISQAKNREVSEFDPTEKYGRGKVYTANLPDLSMEGSHMLICRCNYQVNGWIKWLKANGVIWQNPYREQDLYWNPTRTKTWKAAKNYCRIIKGEALKPKAFISLVECMKTKGNIYHGGKTAIMRSPPQHSVDPFDMYALGFTDRFVDGNIPLKDAINLKGVVGEMLSTMKKEDVYNIIPKVIVGTIHSVKGGEADHVWLDSGVSPLIYKEIINGPKSVGYDEARVAYVGATRARKTLGILGNRVWNPMLPRL